jgi:hypothetical protein
MCDGEAAVGWARRGLAECVRVPERMGVGRGCGRRDRHNYPTNLPLIKLITTNKLLRNQEELRSTSNQCKRALKLYILTTKHLQKKI